MSKTKTKSRAITTDSRIKSVSVSGKKIPVVNVSKPKKTDWKKKYQELKGFLITAESKINSLEKARFEDGKRYMELRTEFDQKVEKNARAAKIISEQADRIKSLENDVEIAKLHIGELLKVTKYYETKVDELTNVIMQAVVSPTETTVSKAKTFMEFGRTMDYVGKIDIDLKNFMTDYKNTTKDWQMVNSEFKAEYPVNGTK